MLQLLPEPTAAAVAFGVERVSRESRRVLVYDLGGGTFDVSVVQVTGRRFDVKAVGGNSHLGGTDVDQLVVEHVAEVSSRVLENLDNIVALILQCKTSLYPTRGWKREAGPHHALVPYIYAGFAFALSV